MIRGLCFLAATSEALRHQPHAGSGPAKGSAQNSRIFTPLDISRVMQKLKKVPVSYHKSLLNVSLSTAEDLPTPAPHHCALVSNSRSLLWQLSGAQIDSTDGPVMRINNASVGPELAVHIGHRREMLLVNDQIPCKWATSRTGPGPEVRYVILNTFGHYTFLRTACLRYVRQAFPEVKLLALNFTRFNDAMAEVMTELGAQSSKWATSGLVAAVVLLNTCQYLSHYGFVTYDSCREHYWDRSRNCTVDLHHELREEHLLMSLISRPGWPGQFWIRGWPELRRR